MPKSNAKPIEDSAPQAAPTPFWRDALPLVVLAALLGAAVCNHFIKPHGDFYEFRETGRALLSGELPPTLKRAPVFPVLVAGLGKLIGAIGHTELPADQLAAGGLNAVLLPVNVLLCFVVGRRWFGGGARWIAAWFALLPTGLYCAAHTLVEPLLVTTILATIASAQRRSAWAYPLAVLAMLTRYDAFGLLVGVALADRLGRIGARTGSTDPAATDSAEAGAPAGAGDSNSPCATALEQGNQRANRPAKRRRSWSVVLVRFALACIPLAIWLGLTWATWQTRAQDHYLAQIAESGHIDYRWPLAAVGHCIWMADKLALPLVIAEWSEPLATAVKWTVLVAAVLGIGVLLVRRAAGGLVLLVGLCGYLAVHAVFPFQFFRFGYPPAALVLLLVGVGMHAAYLWLAPRLRTRAVRVLIAAILVVPILAVLLAESGRVRDILALPRHWAPGLPYFAGLGVLLVALPPFVRGPRRLAVPVATLALLMVAAVNVRIALPLLGEGNERENVVAAAAWMRDHTTPEQGVLTDDPGLLRLYMPDRPAERFVGLGGIGAEQWPDILAECRRRDIAYIIWHDQVFTEQGAYYIQKWRLGRFALLSDPQHAPGVQIVQRYVERPTLWILRVLPE